MHSYWCSWHFPPFFSEHFKCSSRRVDVSMICPLGKCQEHVKITFQMCMRCSQWEYVRRMVWLHSECTWNVPGGNMLGTWQGYIPNVHEMWLTETSQVNSSCPFNVPDMFLPVSRYPCPQWKELEGHQRSRPSPSSPAPDQLPWGCPLGFLGGARAFPFGLLGTGVFSLLFSFVDKE